MGYRILRTADTPSPTTIISTAEFPKDYQYRRISESDYDRLRGAGLDNKVDCKRDTQSAGTLIIRYQDSQAAEIDRVLRHAMHPVQK